MSEQYPVSNNLTPLMTAEEVSLLAEVARARMAAKAS